MDDRQANNAELTPQQLDHLFELFLACREARGCGRRVKETYPLSVVSSAWSARTPVPMDS